LATSPGSPATPQPRVGQRAVFLSYASEDTGAARRLCEALRAGGVEVWFDQSELRGGDAWDQAIRRQIKNCSLFVPIISSNSHSRAEGYFRLEWKLAIDRSHLIAADRPFLLPVVIDDTSDLDERIPERFREVQWIRAPQGEPPQGFVEHVGALLARSPGTESPAGAAAPGSRSLTPAGAAASTPPVQPTSSPTTPPSSAPEPPRQRPKVLWLAAAALLVVTIGVGAVRYFSHPSQVAPYSLEDRRMTFAVLPFHAPADDPQGARVAKASTDAVLANLESDGILAQSAPRARVEAAVVKHTGARELADALDVHFLIRGTVNPASDGYTLKLVVIDGATEQSLASETLAIPRDKLKPVFDDDIDTSMFHLLMAGMHVEVKRVEDRPAETLDVRDLSFRAFDYWRAHRGPEAKNGYVSASDMLRRALALAPDDPFATYLTAQINLCDCVMGWSKNPEEQRAIGTEALNKYLRIDPTDVEMLLDKAGIMQLRGRYDEALVITNSILQRHPDNAGALATQALNLIRLDRAREAVPITDGLAARFPDKWEDMTAIAADAHYAIGDYTAAASLAANAAARMSETDLKSPIGGEIRLTLAAAEAQIGHADRAKRALEDFYAMVPAVRSISAVRKWIYPTDPLTDFQPFYAGLKLAGMPE
jgi:tetratricopeptide (TPR) repeat protein